MSEDINEIHRSLGRVEGKLDSLIDSFDIDNEERNKKHDTLEKRVSKIEAKQHWYAGAASAIGAIAGIFLGGKH